MSKTLIILLLFARFIFAFSNDTLYVAIDNDGKMESISKQKDRFDTVSILKYYDSRLDIEDSKTKVCTKDQKTCFLKYQNCSKSLLFSNNKDECSSNFYSLNSAITLPVRDDNGKIQPITSLVVSSIITPVAGVLGTVFIEKKFNDKYNEILEEYKFEENKKEIFKQFDTNTKKYIPCNLSTFINKRFEVTKESFCKVDEGDGVFVYIKNDDFFSDKKYEFITILSDEELNNPVQASRKITQKLVDNFMNIDQLYPKIPIPEILPQIILQKDEFEKQKEFEKRKMAIIKQREDDQKKLNEKYINDVKDRNENFFKEIQKREKLISSKIQEFQKIAFLSIATPPDFEYISYDAENEKLYGSIKDNNNVKRIEVEIEPHLAKILKSKKSQIKVKMSYKFNQKTGADMQLQNLEIGLDEVFYNAKYTDINFKPVFAEVVVPSYNVANFNEQIQEALKDAGNLSQKTLEALQEIELWRNKSMTKIEDKTIIRTNAKSPDWYKYLSCGNEICATARGETAQKAFENATAQIGCVLNSSITSSFKISKTDDNGFFNEIKRYDLEQTCQNKFQNGELLVTHKTELDGWYYVRVVLKKD